jgi:tRNA(Ile)-lysidine synthase
MLAALASLRDEAAAPRARGLQARPPAFVLRCLHVEHGLRPAEESRGDAGFVAELCEKLAVPCRIAAVPRGKIAETAGRRGIGLEAAARLYRRRILAVEARRLAAGYGGKVYILTAHTGDDLLETVLMRILRGSGPAGLAAMPRRRGALLRPLLGLYRAEVLQYLEEKGVSHRTDSTNADNRYLRNRVRNCLVPQLDELFPHWKRALKALAETQALTADFLREEALARVRWEEAGTSRAESAAPAENSIPAESGAPVPELRTDAGVFFSQPPLVREEALFQGLDRLLKEESAASIRRAVLRRFCGGEDSAADLGPLRIRREASFLFLSPSKAEVSETGFSLLIKEPGLYKLKQVTIEVTPGFYSEAGKDPAEKPPSSPEGAEGFFACLPLLVRRSLSGDSIAQGDGRSAPPPGVKKGNLLSVLDRKGVAAIIGAGTGIFLRRNIETRAGAEPDSGRLRLIRVVR